MCVLFIAVNRHPRHPLILAANRDEFRARKSESMHHWRDHPQILAGRDGEAGGTWLGVNRHGRIAAVTNHRTAEAAAMRDKNSRGELTARFLRGNESLDDFEQFLRDQHRDFKPFNLIYGKVGALRVFCSATAQVRPIDAGIHGISNGAAHELWPKTARGIEMFEARLANGNVDDGDNLLKIMRDKIPAADELLPDTGISRAREKQLSSIFISGDDYGTRTTTILRGDAGQFEITETNYHADGSEAERQHFLLPIQSRDAHC